MPGNALEVTSATFQKEVIEASGEVPILVDFWAPWCGPCQVLKPVLEKLAEQYQGRFRLAKINSDENAELSGRYGVRSIPNVKAFVEGKLVDEFLGAQPESKVREFIDGLLPTPGEILRRQALALRAQGDVPGALALLERAAQSEVHNDAVHVDQVEILLALGRIDEAKVLAAKLGPLAADDPRVSALLAQLRFARAGGEDLATLRARIDSNSADLEARLRLAELEVADKRYEDALEQLLEIIRRDRKWNADAGRRTMLAVFDLLGAQHELVVQYRRKLASALY
jgi:putative thioredoxin